MKAFWLRFARLRKRERKSYPKSILKFLSLEFPMEKPLRESLIKLFPVTEITFPEGTRVIDGCFGK